MSNPETPKKQHGCFFYGCITCLVLLLVVGLTAFFGVRYAIHRVNAMIAEYTDTQPMALPKEEMPAAELDLLKKRFAAFNDALQAHSNAPPFALTGREINALLASAPEMQLFKDRFHVALEGNQIKGQVSLPVDAFFKIPFIDTKGRFLNGVGVFRAVLTNDQFIVTTDSLEVKGKPLPEVYMAKLRNQNLLENTEIDTNAPVISQSESIEIKDGKLILQPKKQD
jgi:hypothetical protein